MGRVLRRRLPPAAVAGDAFPFFFGDPSRALSGAFWGFAASQGNPPYLASLSFGVLPLALPPLDPLPRRREGRFWIAAAGIAFLVSSLPWIPGARVAYESLPFLHSVRYPVKALLVATIAVAVLASLAVERLLLEEALPRWRARAGIAFLVLAGLLGLAAVVARVRPELPQRLMLSLWDPSWASDPVVVLAPVLARLPRQAAASAALLLVAGLLLARGLGGVRGRALLLLALAAEGLTHARFHLPRAPSEWYDRPSPLVAAAARLPGRVFERTGKDVDAVRRGLAGPLLADERYALSLAQVSQGWSLAGAPHGLRYAYDPDPDGSYTLLDRFTTDVVTAREWPARLKWLRAAGVGSVIAGTFRPAWWASSRSSPRDASAPRRRSYRLAAPAPRHTAALASPGRRAGQRGGGPRRRPGLRRATDGVVAGRPPAETDVPDADPGARARVLAEGPDALVVETSGSGPALLLVDRSFTPRVRATVNAGGNGLRDTGPPRRRRGAGRERARRDPARALTSGGHTSGRGPGETVRGLSSSRAPASGPSFAGPASTAATSVSVTKATPSDAHASSCRAKRSANARPPSISVWTEWTLVPSASRTARPR